MNKIAAKLISIGTCTQGYCGMAEMIIETNGGILRTERVKIAQMQLPAAFKKYLGMDLRHQDVYCRLDISGLDFQADPIEWFFSVSKLPMIQFAVSGVRDGVAKLVSLSSTKEFNSNHILKHSYTDYDFERLAG